MEEMLGDRPQVTLDIGPCTMSAEEVKAVVDSLESDWTADDYHVFDKNCVHFADELGARVSEYSQGALALAEVGMAEHAAPHQTLALHGHAPTTRGLHLTKHAGHQISSERRHAFPPAARNKLVKHGFACG